MEVRMKINDAEGKKITHEVIGKNVAIKDSGTRGKVDSRGEMANKTMDPAILAQLNSAHLLADWFNGSGYKGGLNLILTSDTYNQKTMAGAEETVAQAIKKIQERNKDKLVTFNLHVTATYKVTSDDKVLEILKSKKSDMSPKSLEKMHIELTGKQDPRRCDSVIYIVSNIKVDGMPMDPQPYIPIPPIGPDTDLKK
jgi:RNase P/RNase MRP subunit p29